jgi:hypothetical protein
MFLNYFVKTDGTDGGNQEGISMIRTELHISDTKQKW